MPDNEDIPVELHCNLIRILDARLKMHRVHQPKRRKIVEDLCFALSDFFDTGSIEVEGKEYEVEICVKRGRKRYGADFPYHEYAFGNVDWYYGEGGEKVFEEKERAEEELLASISNVSRADEDFPASGYQQLSDTCHQWKTESGYIFAGWIGGAYDETGEAYIWSEYLRESTVEMRVGREGAWGEWRKMGTDDEDHEKRVLKIKVEKGVVELQYRLDGNEFPAVSFEVKC